MILTLTEDLQTLRLIPRSPTPVPLEDRPQESLNREELLELLRRQKVRLHPQATDTPTDFGRFVRKSRLRSSGSTRESASQMKATTN
jgi:hypothetical protein